VKLDDLLAESTLGALDNCKLGEPFHPIVFYVINEPSVHLNSIGTLVYWQWRTDRSDEDNMMDLDIALKISFADSYGAASVDGDALTVIACDLKRTIGKTYDLKLLKKRSGIPKEFYAKSKWAGLLKEL
jgi:hypothetical protein